MPRRCVVIGCLTKGSTQNKSFYRFPNDDELCKKWLKALCNLQLVKIYETQGYTHLNKNKFVCSDHFETKHLRNVKAPSQGLFDGAVPTVNINLNMDALISSLKQSEMLNEITKPKKVNLPLKRSREKTPRAIVSNKLTNDVSNNKKIKLSVPVEPAMSKISSDDIPLKKLYGEKIKIVKEEKSDYNKDSKVTENDSIKHKHSKRKKEKRKKDDPSKKHKKDKKIKSHSSSPNKIVQVFLPSTKISSNSSTFDTSKDGTRLKKLKSKRKNSLANLKKKLAVSKLSDPLANTSIEPVNLSARRKLRIKKLKRITRRKHKTVRKKRIRPKDTTNFIKVIVNSKNIDSEEIKLSQQGPKKIIKMVVPPRNGNETTQGPNQIIKVVVPKTIINGKEINLERSEINKILKLMSAPKNIVGKQIQIGNRNLEVNKVSQQTPVANVADVSGTVTNTTQVTKNNEVSKDISTPECYIDQLITQRPGDPKTLKLIPVPKNIGGKEIKLLSLPNGKILKAVCAPRNIDSRQIKLVTKSSDNSNVLKEVSATSNIDSKRIQMINQYLEINKIVKPTPPPRNSEEVININNDVPIPIDVDRKMVKLLPQTQEHSNVSSQVSSSKNVDREINSSNPNSSHNTAVNQIPTSTNVYNEGLKLSTQSSVSGKVSVPISYGGKKQRIFSQFCENSNNSNVFKEITPPTNTIIETESLVNQNSMDCDMGFDDSTHHSNSNEAPLVTQTSENTESLKGDTPLKTVSNAEVNPMTEELCKRIKLMIGQRFGDFNDSSDSDSQDIPLASYKAPQKSIKQLVESYRGEKNCSCDAIYKEKMKSLAEEEKELKRKLKNVQKYVFHYKDNIRKKNLMVVDLRKQLPVKKPPKTGQLIKTVIPLNKVKEKNPGKYRFTKNLKTFALDLFYSSPLSYNILEKMYFLPSRKTLKNWLTNPKNNTSDLFATEDNNGTVQEHLNSIDENIQVLDENMGVVESNHTMPIQHTTNNMGHHHSMETHMGTIEDNIEPLQENIDDIMFRNDLAEAIMNS